MITFLNANTVVYFPYLHLTLCKFLCLCLSSFYSQYFICVLCILRNAYATLRLLDHLLTNIKHQDKIGIVIHLFIWGYLFNKH